ncbi:WD repeat-containing protein 36 [Sarcoptes scabiei]|uniref:WD repeat-containing protein 36 n=1 Tax=Sarcoptes scabiei TaxID=52283 RepID=A0A834VG99_SARSC|nr:WD repeat-containing protein 36 [Sarcoptes scabiei]
MESKNHLVYESSSRLFEPYKLIGLVSSKVPHLIRYIEASDRIQIITAVGRSFLVFNDRLQLIETCIAHDCEISALTSDSKFLFTAASNTVIAWKHGHRWKSKCFTHQNLSTIIELLSIGGQLLAIDAANCLYCWDIFSQSLVSSLSFEQSLFQMTKMFHPATYLNKILIGSKQGSLKLWNIEKRKLIYQYKGFGSAITFIAQAPSLHVVAIGHQSGLIVLHHLHYDISLVKFQQEIGPVSSITFRTDDSATVPIMISSSNSSGDLAFWNLQAKRLEKLVTNLHWESISGVSMINKQPLMITNSDDNSLKVFRIENFQTSIRLLFQREGHRAPLTQIRFYGDRGNYILSTGLDSTVRYMSIYSERLNRNLGQASMNRNLAKKKGVKFDTNVLCPIKRFAIDYLTEKNWDNLVACHRDSALVSTWNVGRMCMGKHRLMHDRFKQNSLNVEAECVTISACGNFAIIGYNTGHLDRFNIQSGLHRCTYWCNRSDQRQQMLAHQGPVRDVVCDAYNQMIVSVGIDQQCKIWRFAISSSGNQLISSIQLRNPGDKICIHRENQFVAISLDNFHVEVLDLETKRMIRSFHNHQNRITDMTFDSEGRRLFVSSMNSLIFIWDMLSGQLIDLIHTLTPCVSLTLSPTNEFLATAHVNDPAIYLWSNLSIYTKVNLRPIQLENFNEIPLIRLPSLMKDESNIAEDDEEDRDEEQITDHNLLDNRYEDGENVFQVEYRSPEQISKHLISLSDSNLNWKILLAIETIRKRNKPKEAVEKSKLAPFFLPCSAGLKPKFNFQESNQMSDDINKDNIIKPHRYKSLFAEELEKHLHSDSLTSYFRKIADTMGPSKIEAEIINLRLEWSGTIDPMLNFLNLIEKVCESNGHFEIANSFLALFLKLHLNDCQKETLIKRKVREIVEENENKYRKIQSMFDQILCLTNFLRNSLV